MNIHRGSGELIWQYICDGKGEVETQEHDAGICVLTLAFPFAIIWSGTLSRSFLPFGNNLLHIGAFTSTSWEGKAYFTNIKW